MNARKNPARHPPKEGGSLSPEHKDFPNITAIERAAEVLSAVLWPTPPRPLSGRGDFYVKPENLQRTGSFKIRGAYFKVSTLDREVARRGVVAYSSGNHGQAVACAAELHGYPATIVMPESAVAEKRQAVLSYGARVIDSRGGSDERRAIAEDLAQRDGLALVPPYDDREIVTGQATVGLEIARDVPTARVVLLPVGGGGLISGVAIAVRALLPGVRVIGVEPEGANDAQQSLRAGRHMAVAHPVTSADGLMAQRVGELNWRIISEFVDDIVTVTESEIEAAVRHLALRARIVAEPSGAVAAAALLSSRVMADGTAVAVVSGGNVSPAYLRGALAPR